MSAHRRAATTNLRAAKSRRPSAPLGRSAAGLSSMAEMFARLAGPVGLGRSNAKLRARKRDLKSAFEHPSWHNAAREDPTAPSMHRAVDSLAWVTPSNCRSGRFQQNHASLSAVRTDADDGTGRRGLHGKLLHGLTENT